MRVIMLGGLGAFPTADEGCCGFLIEHSGQRVLIDPGYGTLAGLQARMPAAGIDAVYVSHGHPDHCADLQPLLRVRVLTDRSGPALPVYAPVGSLGPLLAIDEPGMLDPAYELREFEPGAELSVGGLRATTWSLPHWVPNAGVRFEADGSTVAWTGDTGPSPDLVVLARDVDLLIAEATYADEMPERHAGYLSTAAEVGRYAAEAGARRVVLAHRWPGTDPETLLTAARQAYDGPVSVAAPGLTVDLDEPATTT
ncbi:MBL fold metallo-hydrolase [Plantactinospora sp. GCM10030261]|uniref:MBL fold metallo-hydrolase n=1 Tax=Plantactinospora sp. GCM10030261 TaxID=3273420 RepID=UPI00360F7B8A